MLRDQPAQFIQLKVWRRLRLVLSNSLNQIILILFGPLFSFIVIRSASLEIWGSFVQVLIVVQVGAHIVSWGNKEYLLRAFSRNPADIRPAWQAALAARLPLLLLLLLVLALFYRQAPWPFLWLWAIGVFLAQSFDVLVVYKRDFLVAALAELSLLVLLVGFVFFQRDALSVGLLIRGYGTIQLMKGGFYTLFYARETLAGLPDKGLSPLAFARYLRLAMPFFLLTFSGMLHSRVDLIAVNIFLPPRDIAEYQVFINFMLYLQAASGFILLPFVKSIYRLRYPAILKIARRLFLIGLILVPLAMPLVNLVLTWLYGIDLPPHYFLWGALYVLPMYFYSPLIYSLFKAEKQNLVVGVNLVAVVINFLLDLILIPRMGSAGAILTIAVGKWLILMVYTREFYRLKQQAEQEPGRISPLPRAAGPSNNG